MRLKWFTHIDITKYKPDQITVIRANNNNRGSLVNVCRLLKDDGD